MNWLVLSCFLTLGFLPCQRLELGNNYLSKDGCLEQTVGLQVVAWKHARLWTEIETYDFKNDEGISFSPFRSDYRIGFELFDDNFTIGMKHECDHPVLCDTDKDGSKYYMGQTEAYLRFSFSTEK